MSVVREKKYNMVVYVCTFKEWFDKLPKGEGSREYGQFVGLYNEFWRNGAPGTWKNNGGKTQKKSLVPEIGELYDELQVSGIIYSGRLMKYIFTETVGDLKPIGFAYIHVMKRNGDGVLWDKYPPNFAYIYHFFVSGLGRGKEAFDALYGLRTIRNLPCLLEVDSYPELKQRKDGRMM